LHFVVIAYDGKDSEVSTRRNIVREKHLIGVRKLIKEQKHLYGAAILDDDDRMIGSVLIVDYPSKEILESEWLNNEPYVTGNVWQEITIKPCKVPEFFLDTKLA